MTDATQTASRSEGTGPWAPFGQGAFLLLWGATVISNVGTWMHDVGAGWLMTGLDPSPQTVVLVQAATTLPVFLFALPAGAIADIVDRKRLLIVANAFMAVVAAALALLVARDAITVTSLLIITFLLGTGAAFIQPAWQAVVPQLVPRPQLQSAIALNSMGINVSRAIGPALAGLLIAAVGLAAPFVLNAVSFLFIIAALLLWKQPPRPERRLPPERVGAAILAGLRYVSHSAPFKATLVRALAFFSCASAYWALLPLIVRDLLGGDAGLYGVLLGCVGAGAVSGALLLPRLKRRLDANGIVLVGTLGTAASLLLLGLVPLLPAAIAACVIAGLSWIAVLSSLHVGAQTALPDWVRARGLSVFLTLFFGAMAGGGILWGQVAGAIGLPGALAAAAAGIVVLLVLARRAKLGGAEHLDLGASMHWPEPITAGEIDGDEGPVMITITYEIDPADRAAFAETMHGLSQSRRRDGAYDWGLYEDAETPGRFIEYFLVGSWNDHLRQHERVTHADKDTQDAARAFHRGGEPPVVRHWLAADGTAWARGGRG